MPTPRKPALVFILITLALDVLGFGLLIPVAPSLVKSMLHGGAGGTEGEAATVVGALMATFSAMAFLFSPLLGALSDTVGRRPVILFSLLGSGIDYFAQALAPTLPIFFVTRALNGLTGASMAAASAYVADVTPPEKRAAGFGLIGAAFGIGFVLGPLIGGLLGEHDVRLPFYAAGVLTMINWLYGCFVLPESHPPEKRVPFSLARANPVGMFPVLSRYPVVLGLAVSFFFSYIAQYALHATWALSNELRFGWSKRTIGLSLFAVGVCAAIVQGALAKKLIALLGERTTVLAGLLVSVLAFASYGLAAAGWVIFATIILASLGGAGQPAAQAIITKSVSPLQQGAVQGAFTSIQSLAGVVGPVLGSVTFKHFVSPDRQAKIPGAPFLLGSLLSLVCFLMVAATFRVSRDRAAGAGG